MSNPTGTVATDRLAAPDAVYLVPPNEQIRDAPDTALPAALPGPCREDLDLLQGSIRELSGGRPAGPTVPADRFGAVFLTGATGFVGRYVLSELLRQNDHMLVHCLVRAENAKQALARVQAALEAAGLWDDYLADRIGPGRATCASRGSACRSWTSGGCVTRSTRSTTWPTSSTCCRPTRRCARPARAASAPSRS